MNFMVEDLHIKECGRPSSGLLFNNFMMILLTTRFVLLNIN